MLGALALCLAPAFASMAQHAPAAAKEDAHATAEEHLHHALELLDNGRLVAAIGEMERLVSRYPNFRLAQVVLGDMLRARAGRAAERGAAAPETQRIAELRAELRARMKGQRDPPPAGYVPRNLMRLSPGQKHAIVVDASRSRVYVFENRDGAIRLVRDYYSTLGLLGMAKEREGDKKTPVGAYLITAHIPGARLPDLYGWGAFPINYPNEWDLRLGRSGNGIWIHGVPSETYARAPLASDGCVALANEEIADLAVRVQPGVTPIVIAEQVEWISPQALRAEHDLFQGQLDQWRRDWERRNVDAYLAHYSRNFRSESMDRATWAARKRRVNATKTWSKIELRDLSILRNPGSEPLIVVTYEQDYRSNNLSNRLRKRQYWIVEDGRWKIAYEGRQAQGSGRMPDSFQQGRRYARQ